MLTRTPGVGVSNGKLTPTRVPGVNDFRTIKELIVGALHGQVAGTDRSGFRRIASSKAKYSSGPSQTSVGSIPTWRAAFLWSSMKDIKAEKAAV